MGATFVSAVAASTVLMGIALSKVTGKYQASSFDVRGNERLPVILHIAVSHLIPGLTFCVPLSLPKNFYAFWIPALVSETLLCGLALYRGLQGYFNRKNVYQSGRRLLEVLIRDSFLYFFV